MQTVYIEAFNKAGARVGSNLAKAIERKGYAKSAHVQKLSTEGEAYVYMYRIYNSYAKQLKAVFNKSYVSDENSRLIIMKRRG